MALPGLLPERQQAGAERRGTEDRVSADEREIGLILFRKGGIESLQRSEDIAQTVRACLEGEKHHAKPDDSYLKLG